MNIDWSKSYWVSNRTCSLCSRRAAQPLISCYGSPHWYCDEHRSMAAQRITCPLHGDVDD